MGKGSPARPAFPPKWPGNRHLQLELCKPLYTGRTGQGPICQTDNVVKKPEGLKIEGAREP